MTDWFVVWAVVGIAVIGAGIFVLIAGVVLAAVMMLEEKNN